MRIGTANKAHWRRLLHPCQRRQKGKQQYEKVDARGRDFQVEENELKFWVNLDDYLDTGLFLDHRNLRQRVRDEAEAKRVLNLFAYTGSFTVYAAAGGASSRNAGIGFLRASGCAG